MLSNWKDFLQLPTIDGKKTSRTFLENPILSHYVNVEYILLKMNKLSMLLFNFDRFGNVSSFHQCVEYNLNIAGETHIEGNTVSESFIPGNVGNFQKCGEFNLYVAG